MSEIKEWEHVALGWVGEHQDVWLRRRHDPDGRLWRRLRERGYWRGKSASWTHNNTNKETSSSTSKDYEKKWLIINITTRLFVVPVNAFFFFLIIIKLNRSTILNKCKYESWWKPIWSITSLLGSGLYKR